MCVCVWGGGWRYKLPRTVHYATEDDEGEDSVCVCVCGGGGGWRYKLPRTVHYVTEDDEGEDSVCVWGGGGVGGINCPGLSTTSLRMMRVRTLCVCVWGGGGGLEVETAQERPLRH